MLARVFTLLIILLSSITVLVFSATESQLPIAVLVNDPDFESKKTAMEKTLTLFEANFEIYMTFNDEFPEPGTFSALIVDGGKSMHKYFDDEGNKLEGSILIENANVPVLGVCMGCQIIERIYGGRLCFYELRGWAEMTIVKDDPLLEGLDENFDAWSNHGFGLAVVPEDFELLCEGEDGSIQVIKHSDKPIYGILFHPEMTTKKENPAKKIMENYILYVEDYVENDDSSNMYASKH